MHFKIDWDSLIVGTKFTVFALFYFVCEGNFPSTSPLGAYIGRGDLTGGGGFVLPVWGAYIWRGLYMEGLIFRILQYCIITGLPVWPSHKMGFRSSAAKNGLPGEGRHEGLVPKTDVLTNGSI